MSIFDHVRDLYHPILEQVMINDGLSDKLGMAVRVILDSKRDKFCLSCNLYTRRLTDLELNDLVGYFVNNGFPNCSIKISYNYKKFIILNPEKE
jgi:hypothetical protein